MLQGSGIDIKILVPGKPDKRFVYLATKSYFEDLMKVGIEIYAYNEKFMHSKVMIIDDKNCICWNSKLRSS